MFEVSVKLRKFVVGVLFLGYAVLVVSLWQLPDNRFHIYFLDVGQGDSIFIKTQENHQILVDGGPKNFVVEELNDVMPFFDKSIDLVILTHPHADHVGGLVEVIKRYEVSNVLMTGVNFDDPYYQEFLKELRERAIPFFIAESESDFLFGDVFFDVIYPFDSIAGRDFDNLNNFSIAAKVIYGENSILLTGDLEKEAEAELANSGAELEADILKAGHHGSKNASSEAFLEKVNPKIVVIQCGEDNSFGHPHAVTLRNFYRAGVEAIYRTDLDGRVDFSF